MILPIVAYGDAILRKVGVEIDAKYPDLNKLIIDMKETMYNAKGVGLAAPQIGKSIRLFVIDASPFAEDEELSEEDKNALKKFNHVFINAKILKEEGEQWIFNEGCLSIPNIRADVFRQEKITVEYQDEHFEKRTMVLNGLVARIFQHEHDHIEGILFTDKIASLKKKLFKKKLENISKGKIIINYKMRFPNAKRK